jgi:hypothetical protein
MSWIQRSSNKTRHTTNLCSLVPFEILAKWRQSWQACLAGMRTGLWAVGFTIASSDKIVDKQGYNSLTALAELTDQTCADLVALIQKPGGTIPNPDLSAAGAPLHV